MQLQRIKSNVLAIVMAALTFSVVGLPAMANPVALLDVVPNVFTYQGRLERDGVPIDGTADIIVRLFDGATFIDSDTVLNVNVDDGLFTVELSFAAPLFNGTAYDLEFVVRSPAGVGAFTTLSPRQPITTAPYAFHANTANTLLTPASIVGDDSVESILAVRNESENFGDNGAMRVTQGAVDNAVGGVITRVVEVESANTAMGVAGFGDRFGLAGFVDMNATNGLPAGVLGQVLFGGTATQVGMRAIHSPGGTRVDLATETLAGQFFGDVEVDGEITRSYSFGTFDRAVPIAYGYIDTDGSILSGTPNFTSTWNAASSRYEIEIDGENYFFSDYVTAVTPALSNQRVRVSSVGGRMLVYVRDTGTNVDEQGFFQFITFKPGAPTVEGRQRRVLQPLNPEIPEDTATTPRVPTPRKPVPPRDDKGAGGTIGE